MSYPAATRPEAGTKQEMEHGSDTVPMLTDILHRLQAQSLIWLVSATLMLADDAAMLAVMFC